VTSEVTMLRSIPGNDDGTGPVPPSEGPDDGLAPAGVPLQPKPPADSGHAAADTPPPDSTATRAARPTDTAYEIELDEPSEPATAPVPVDRPPAAEGERRAVIPVHLLPANLPATTRRAAARTAHVGAFHAVRCPWYGFQAAGYAARGALRLAGQQLAWWWVRDQAILLRHAADSGELAQWSRIHREVKQTRLWRGIVLAAEAAASTVAVVVAWHAAPAVLALAGLGAVLVLAHHGRPAGRSIIGTAVVAPRFRKLNSDIVLRAYYAAGLGNADKPAMQVHFGSPMARDARNTGSQVVIDLPYGKGWSDVASAAAREKIASGLDVHVNQVFLTPDKTSTRRHLLFVADSDPLAVPAGPSDLLDCKPRSIWQPVRFGKDERGRLVLVALMWVSVLIGAQPRKGKTFAARLLALHAALDPWVQLYIVDGKDSPDWDKFRMVAHRIIFGTHPNPRDSDPVAHLLEALDEILDHIAKVNQVLAALPVTVCPEGKLTEALSRDPRYPDLRVVLLVMEEFQTYFETENQEVNKEIAAKLSRIQAVGPSAGVSILSASQKPSGVGAGDVGRLFNRYRDNHAVRFALKCGNRIVSEAVLGGDAYAEGYDASSLPVGKEYLGLGYLYGMTDATPTVRTFLADHPDAEKILTAARACRERLGTLTGTAAGQEAARAVRDVLADVAAALDGDSGVQWPALAARLAERMPDHYADLTAEALSAQLRALGVPSVDIKRDGQVLKGAKADAISQATARRKIHAA
jgi:S-DNA-T family DNA segregation ATPase FtsK/SpoIIIE